jgi:hypothetical protein
MAELRDLVLGEGYQFERSAKPDFIFTRSEIVKCRVRSIAKHFAAAMANILPHPSGVCHVGSVPGDVSFSRNAE